MHVYSSSRDQSDPRQAHKLVFNPKICTEPNRTKCFGTSASEIPQNWFAAAQQGLTHYTEWERDMLSPL